MNFNISHQPEYQLNSSLISEVIKLYGIQIKFIKVEPIKLDKVVFGDFEHLKADNSKIYDLFALPENTDSFDISNYNFDEFGLTSYENISLFISADDFKPICQIGEIVGKLVILPNGKVMEVTNIDWMVPGINNLYTFNDRKSVYKLYCVPYNFKVTDEIDYSSRNVGNAIKAEFDGLTSFITSADSSSDEKSASTLESANTSNTEKFADTNKYSEFENLSIFEDQTDLGIEHIPELQDLPIQDQTHSQLVPKMEDITDVNLPDENDPISNLINTLDAKILDVKKEVELKDSSTVVQRTKDLSNNLSVNSTDKIKKNPIYVNTERSKFNNF